MRRDVLLKGIMNKQCFGLLILILLVGLITACNGYTVRPAGEEAMGGVGEVPNSEEVAAAMVCTDPWGCVTIPVGDTLDLGSVLALSGPQTERGLDSQHGLEIALEDKPEVAGHPLNLIIEDGRCSAEAGEAAATKLAANKNIVAIVGHNCSASCSAAIPIYNEAALTMISPSCVAPDLTRSASNDSFLRTAYNDNEQGQVLAKFIYNELGLRKVALITANNNPEAAQLPQVFAAVFTKLGGQITAQESINYGDTDMQPLLVAIADTQAELIYYPVSVTEAVAITRQARNMSALDGVILAGSGDLLLPEFLAATGQTTEGMLLSGLDFEFEGHQYDDFLAKYQTKYDQVPLDSFHTYDAAMMLLAAIEQVAEVDAAGNTLIGRQALREALYATTNFEGITGRLSCNNYGDCADSPISVYQVQAGAFVPLNSGYEVIKVEKIAYTPLPLQELYHYHPSNAYSFPVPVAWVLSQEDEFRTMFVSQEWQAVLGATFFDLGGENLKTETLVDLIVRQELNQPGLTHQIITQDIHNEAIEIKASYSSNRGQGQAAFYIKEEGGQVFVLYLFTPNYKELNPTWNSITPKFNPNPDTQAAKQIWLSQRPYLAPNETFSLKPPLGWLLLDDDTFAARDTAHVIKQFSLNLGILRADEDVKNVVDTFSTVLLDSVAPSYNLVEYEIGPDGRGHIFVELNPGSTSYRQARLHFFRPQPDTLFGLYIFSTNYKASESIWLETLASYTPHPQAIAANAILEVPYIHPSQAFSLTFPSGWSVAEETNSQTRFTRYEDEAEAVVYFIDTSTDNSPLLTLSDEIFNHTLTSSPVMDEAFIVTPPQKQTDGRILAQAFYASAATAKHETPDGTQIGIAHFIFEKRDGVTFVVILYFNKFYADWERGAQAIANSIQVNPQAAYPYLEGE